MPKKQKKKTRRTKKSDYYEVSGGKVNLKRTPCPKCGPGVFMAEHKDRYHCGRCGYTMMKNSKPEKSEKTGEEKPEITKAENNKKQGEGKQRKDEKKDTPKQEKVVEKK